MKNIKTKIILSAIVCLSVVGLAGTVNAAGASLYVSPASITKTAGNTFSASVGFTVANNKVCAVEGTLVFNNLTCQSITVATGLMAQTAPTCSDPRFVIGIPNCATSDKTLLTASVKAGSAGTASISVTGVDIIGEGVSVGSVSTKGNYTINAVPTPTPTPTPTPNPTQRVVEPTEQTTEEVVTPAEQTAQENNLTADIGTASLASAGMKWYNYFAIAIVILVVLYGIYYFAIKRKRKI
jgi:hypothetical protein